MDSIGQLIYVCIFGFSLGYHIIKIKRFGFKNFIHNEYGIICWEMEDAMYQILYQISFLLFGFYNDIGIFQLAMVLYSASYISYIFGMMGEPIVYYRLSLLRIFITPILLALGGFFNNVF